MRWLVFALALTAVLALPVSGAAGQSASSGGKTLTISRANGLNPAGETITVSGSGFDMEKGIYVALCVTPAPGGTPSPCGGGADIGGSGGSSVWVSSNPPPYGVGLAVPYGDGGTFSVQLQVGPVIKEGTDCRSIPCAVVTRADHTRLTDRSQDVVVPVTFRSETQATATSAPPQPTAAATSAPGQTATPTAQATAVPSPSATAALSSTALPANLSRDGLTATAGSLELSTSRAHSLSDTGATVTVKGQGYDSTRGVFVALCAVAAGRAPGPCFSGSSDASAWISSNPPEALKARAKPYGEGGAFEVQLSLKPVIDSATDCRKTACAITTRNDDSNSADRTQDVAIPVTFAAVGQATVSATAAPRQDDNAGAADDEDGGGSSAAVWVGAGVAVLALLGGGGFFLAKRRSGTAVATLLVVLLLGACGDSDDGDSPAPNDAPILVGTASAQALPVTVQSADGREVEITDTTRIVSLWGNLTELVFGLGLGESVVGRDSTATFAEVSSLPLVTRGHDASVEGVLSLNPTLVLASKDNSGPSSALDQIRNVGVPVLVLRDPESVEDISPRIRLLAQALGIPAAGEALVAQTERQLEDARAGIPSSHTPPKVAFLYMRGQAGVYLIAGPKSGADSIIRAAGAIDAGTAMGLGQPFTPLTSEALAKAAPDVILMTTSGLESVGGIDGLVKIPGIAQTPAGKAKRIVAMEDSLLYSFGPRTPLAVEQLIGALYGGLAQSPR